MDRRELRYMKMYGKYLGVVFVMLERQSKITELIITVVSVVIGAGISYLAGVGILALTPSVRSIGELLGLWVFVTGMMAIFLSLFILALIAVFANEIYKEYQSTRSDYARKEKDEE